MFSIITAAADRLVGLVAPKAVAAACTPTSYTKVCGCTSSGYARTQKCNLDYYCHETCGTCTTSSTLRC